MKQQAYGRNVGLLRNARGNGGLNFEFAVESSSTTSLWGKNAIYSEDTCSNSNTVRQNWAATQICFVLTMEESKQEKVPLMTSVWHLMICERAAVACAKRRDALCFVQFKLEQASVLAVKTCAKILREGSDLANTLLLQALLDIHQSKPMRVIMKKTCRTRTPEKDRWKKDSQKGPYAHLNEVEVPKSSEYCVPIRKKSYHYMSGIVGMAYNPFIDDDIGDCYFDYEQAVMLRFWSSRI